MILCANGMSLLANNSWSIHTPCFPCKDVVREGWYTVEPPRTQHDLHLIT